jgi:hypothetical protein
MELVAAWCAERGLAIEPYGVDISPALAELARRRLPRWADRIWTGNAVDWQPPGAMRFDYAADRPRATRTPPRRCELSASTSQVRPAAATARPYAWLTNVADGPGTS